MLKAELTMPFEPKQVTGLPMIVGKGMSLTAELVQCFPNRWRSQLQWRRTHRRFQRSLAAGEHSTPSERLLASRRKGGPVGSAFELGVVRSIVAIASRHLSASGE